MSISKERLAKLPSKPGVYLFKNRGGEVLYVGKAKNLKNRLKSYFLKTEAFSPRIALMLEQISDIDYVIVSSEIESLILENNFIKQYRPRFNIRLRDDKNYQFIKIDYSTEIPQIYPVRKITPSSSPPYQGGERKGVYFGPYTSPASVKETLKLLGRIFRLCRNKKVGIHPCFAYHLGRCDGVCTGKVSLEVYRKTFAQVEKFLNHKPAEILRELKSQMLKAARLGKFETAAMLRDKLQGLQKIWETQKVVFTKPLSQDYFGLHSQGERAIVNLFMVRQGKLIHQEFFELQNTESAEPGGVLEAFLNQYYGQASNIPKEVIIKYILPEENVIEKWLNLKIIVPKRGKKLELIKLAEENAKDYFEKHYTSLEVVLRDLQTLLKLPASPQRIEAYDISNIQGFLPVGSLVVFESGLPKKSDYQKFKINFKQMPDDVAMMKEILTRRFSRLPTTSYLLPDLIIIDGGRSQLNVALSVLRAKSYQLIPTIGLAKRLEEIYLPNKKEPIRLPPDSPILHLLQRVRDEAHRFAITFYRLRHRKAQTVSYLDEIPGIGPKLRKKLLQKFGSLAAIRQASLEDLSQVIGKKLAQKIKELL